MVRNNLSTDFLIWILVGGWCKGGDRKENSISSDIPSICDVDNDLKGITKVFLKLTLELSDSGGGFGPIFSFETNQSLFTESTPNSHPSFIFV